MDKKENQQAEMAVSVNFDQTPILYTDNIQMTTNEDGVVLDVMQRLMNTNQMRIVARLGMSRTHAKKFVKELSALVAVTEGKAQTNKGN